MAKQISYDAEAREHIRIGVKKLARAVKVTLGPRGRNVIIEKSFGSPTVTKDGVTVSKEVELEDKYENMGAQLVKEVASRTNDGAGDGTTTGHGPGRGHLREGLKQRHRRRQPGRAQARHREGRRQRRGRAPREDLEEGQGPRRHRQGRRHRRQQRPEIGKMIAEAMDRVGKDGVITVEEGKSLETDRRVGRGHAVRQGLPVAALHHRPQEMECVLEDAYVLVHEKKISSIKDMIPLLEEVDAQRSPAVHHRRGHRGRSPGHARRQPPARRVPVRRGQGTRLRRPPQGHARGHRRPLTGGTAVMEATGGQSLDDRPALRPRPRPRRSS